ncbi:MAG: hypothetical protein ABR955_01470 [Verrucomicrobiota bacterium]|jgi:hypothetical protein
MNYQVSRYGCLFNLPDHRDHVYAARVEPAGALNNAEYCRRSTVYDRKTPKHDCRRKSRQ